MIMNEMHGKTWIKSSYSDSAGGQCVEWAPALVSDEGAIPVRDSKDTGRPALRFGENAWSAFVMDLKRL
ncbi:DUF397 domain-containing protein [Streptomyces cacaoi]